MTNAFDLTLTWRDVPAVVVTFWLGFAAVSVSHELGHYFMARAFGIRPEAVVLGSYVVVYDRLIVDTRFVVNAISVPWETNRVDFAPGDYRINALIWVFSAGILTNFVSAVFIGLGAWFFGSRIAMIVALIAFSFALGMAVPIDKNDGSRVWSLITKQRL
jgi:Zn-dependent protease